MRNKWDCRVCGGMGEQRNLMFSLYHVTLCDDHMNSLNTHFNHCPQWMDRVKIRVAVQYWEAQSSLPDPQRFALKALEGLVQQTFALDAQLSELIKAWITTAAAAHAEQGGTP